MHPQFVYNHFTKEPIPSLGDWSLIVDDLDPFRDGRAAYRINTYLHWIHDGFKKGLDRDGILDNAAQRYALEWGNDKVICNQKNQ